MGRLTHVAHNKSKIFQTHNAIALAENYQELKHELSNAKELGTTKDGKKILLYACKRESTILKEIGRLREISFRQIKEGSGKKRDIDKYDLFYEHIILWDENDLQIVGSYRICKTKYIINDIDIAKLYTSTLFNYKESFKPYLTYGLELGRSFIQPKYWNSRALDYLWQGIGAYLKANNDIKYMFGPVSISKTYNYYSTALLIYFYRHYFDNNTLHVTHKKSL